MATETLRPDGAGDYENITTVEYGNGGANHYEAVDEASADEDATFVEEGGTSERKDAYSLENTSIPGGTINSVRVYFRYRGVDASVSNFAKCIPYLRLGANETVGPTISTFVNTYSTLSEALARPGGGNWSVSDLNSLQVAIGLWKIGTATASRCTQVYVVVDYAASYNRSASVVIGVVASASRIYGLVRVASVIVGVVASAAKIYGAVKTASVIVGTLVAGGTGWTGTTTVYVGIVAVATSFWRHLAKLVEKARFLFPTRYTDPTSKISGYEDPTTPMSGYEDPKTRWKFPSDYE